MKTINSQTYLLLLSCIFLLSLSSCVRKIYVTDVIDRGYYPAVAQGTVIYDPIYCPPPVVYDTDVYYPPVVYNTDVYVPAVTNNPYCPPNGVTIIEEETVIIVNEGRDNLLPNDCEPTVVTTETVVNGGIARPTVTTTPSVYNSAIRPVSLGNEENVTNNIGEIDSDEITSNIVRPVRQQITQSIQVFDSEGVQSAYYYNNTTTTKTSQGDTSNTTQPQSIAVATVEDIYRIDQQGTGEQAPKTVKKKKGIIKKIFSRQKRLVKGKKNKAPKQRKKRDGLSDWDLLDAAGGHASGVIKTQQPKPNNTRTSKTHKKQETKPKKVKEKHKQKKQKPSRRKMERPNSPPNKNYNQPSRSSKPKSSSSGKKVMKM